MANEFKVKNGLIVIGDLTTSGTITINGALAATQSWVTSQAYLTSASLSGYATQSYVTSAISALIDAAPAALDTLNELAAALGDDASFSTTVTNSIASKLPLAGGTLTGDLNLNYGYPRINFYDDNHNPDYSLINNDGGFSLYDITNNVHRLWVSSSGNVGIGTTSPARKLVVNGETWINLTSDYFGGGTTVQISAGGTGAVGIQSNTFYLYPYSSDTATNLVYGYNGSASWNLNNGGNNRFNFFSYAGGITVMSLTSGGNVGIGTTSPATPLHVTGGASGSGGWNRTATLAATYPGLIFNSNGTKWGGMAYDYSAAMRFWVNANNDDIFAGTLAMSILNNGNVGIGTSDPIYKLQVVGSAYVNGGTLFLDSSQYLRWGNSNQGIVGVNDDHVAIVSGGATRQTVYADGRTYFPGLDLSISNVNSSHGTGTYFRGSSTHFVLGLNNGNTLYLNYGNDGGSLQSFGTWSHQNVQILSTTRVLTNVSGNISMFTNDAGYLRLNTWEGNSYIGTSGAHYGTIFYDSNNDSYYLDPNSTSNLYRVDAAAQMRAPIFYDSQDTNYYVDPNATSVLSSAHFDSGLLDNANTRIYMPGGAYTVNNSWATAGAIKISLPTACFGSNTMMSMTIHVYEYSTGQSFTIKLGGYNYYTHDWYNVFAYLLNDSGKVSDVPVYFGHDGSRDVIWLGNTDWSWSYPNVFVTDFQAGHSQNSNWKTGWSISFSASARTNVTASKVAYRQIDTGNYTTWTATAAQGTKADTAYSWGNHATAGYLTSVSDVWVNTTGDTMTGSLTFANNADDVRINKNNNWLNLYDPWNNIHLRNGNSGYGVYIDSSIHYWRPHDGSVTWMTLSSTGLGIGTHSPSSKLTVYSDTTADGILVDVLSRPRITLRDRGNSDTIIGTGDYGLDDFFIDTYSGNAFAIKGSTRNVGIGTTSPSEKLEVSGNISVTSSTGTKIGFNTTDSFSGYGTSIAHYGISYSWTAQPLALSGYYGVGIFTVGTERMRINGGGKVSIGTTDTNSDKSDFTVYTGGNTSIALAGNLFRVGESDINWDIALRQNGVLQTYAQNLYLNTVAGNYPVIIQPNGVSSVSFYQSDSYINTYTKINYNWGGGDYGAEALTIRGTNPSITLRSTNANFKWLLHTDASGNFRWYTGSEADNNAWTNRFTFGIDNNFYVDYGHVYASGGNSTQWSTAYSWGNHASQGYLTSYTETDTLASVTGRGAVTSVTNVQFNDGVTLRRNTASGPNVHTYVINSGGGYSSAMYIGANPGADWLIGKDPYGDGNDKFKIGSWNGYAYIDITYNATAGTINFPNNGGLTVNNNTIWHAGNDGSGSGLDADTVDGLQASVFATRQDGARYSTDVNSLMSSGFYNVEATPPNSPVGYGQIIVAKGIDTAFQIAGGYSNNALYFRGQGYGPEAGGFYPWRRVWHNDDFSSTNISNWNTAYGWGNHASQGYATTSYVTTQINNLINGAPGALDTLDELAAALGDDSNFATTVTNSIAGKVSKSGDTMTGNINWNTQNTGLTWNMNTDGAYIKFFNTGDGDTNSRLEYSTSDNGDEYHRWVIAGVEKMNLKWGGLTVTDTIYASGGNSGNWNTAYGWGDHSSVGYALNSSLANYLPLSGGVIGGAVTINGNLTVNGTITENSSIKLKENVETSEGNLEKVVNLRPVTYNKIGSQTTELGLIAEEVAEVYPEFVQYDENGEPVGVHYSRLTAALIGAVKELNEQLQELKRNK